MCIPIIPPPCGNCGESFDECLCWEPGGPLGNDADHAVAVSDEELTRVCVSCNQCRIVGCDSPVSEFNPFFCDGHLNVGSDSDNT